MNKFLTTAAITLGIIGGTAAVNAQDDFPFKREIQARQAFMKIKAFNLGTLGAMAKGEMEYNADAAIAAANNLLAAAQMDNTAMWPAGSDASAEGLAEKTRAKKEMWDTYPEVVDKQKALIDAVTQMAAVAGDGLEAVQSNMKAVGDGCKGCHEDFRVPKDE